MSTRELLLEEVEELTDLLRTDDEWSGLRAELSRNGHDPMRLQLAGFCEDECGKEYGVFLHEDGLVSFFVRDTNGDGRFIGFGRDVPGMTASDFPALAAAIAVRKE